MKGIPEQVTRLLLIGAFIVLVLLLARYFLVPKDFGEHGHYRTSAVDEIISQDIGYAGQSDCAMCHDDVMETKMMGYHKDVACEVCHGPGAAHIDYPDSISMEPPKPRDFCPRCHEYLPSRPTGFPQIVSVSHNPMHSCTECHDPHSPKPQQTPQACEACHAEISRTKSLSRHMNVPCIRCHETPEEHKVNPRQFLPSKPITRDFCGGCHSVDADSDKGIPRIDMATHEERYTCWQCHYPHLPEAK